MPVPAAPQPAAGPTRLRIGLVVAAAWTAFGLASAGLTYANYAREGLPITLGATIASSLPLWWYWALATPLVVWCTARFTPYGRGWPGRALVHLVAAEVLHVGSAVVGAQAVILFFPRLGREPLQFRSVFTSYITGRWPFDLLVYAAIAGIWLTLDGWRRLREREAHAGRLEAQLANAQLAALRMQLHPHFLYNTLQAAAMLVDEDPRAAREMLAQLGDLLRAVLDERARQEVPLADELAFLRRYLAIEETRFSDRLAVRFAVEAGLDDVLVPSFLLQPLVENAVRYAVAPRAAPGTITVGARAEAGRLVLAVRDDGPGPPARWTDGVGLSTTRARLAKLYGPDGTLRLARAEGGGAEAVITLPLRRAGEAADA